jgi:hypothetical protein
MSICHNQIKISSFGLHTTSIGDVLYYITSHLLESTKKKKKCMLVCPTKVSKPSLRYLWTHNLKLKISLMSFEMKGRPWEIINVCIKLVKMYLFYSFKILERYPKCFSVSSCVCVQQLRTPISPPQTLVMQSIEKDM